eukprot:834904-Amphidinium_carterae.2
MREVYPKSKLAHRAECNAAACCRMCATYMVRYKGTVQVGPPLSHWLLSRVTHPRAEFVPLLGFAICASNFLPASCFTLSSA